MLGGMEQGHGPDVLHLELVGSQASERGYKGHVDAFFAESTGDVVEQGEP